MELGETMKDGGNRECFEEAEAIGSGLELYCLYDIPDIGQIHMIFIGSLKDGKIWRGHREPRMCVVAEEDIPWEDLAFQNVIETLQHYFADRKAGATLGNFPIHQQVIAKYVHLGD